MRRIQLIFAGIALVALVWTAWLVYMAATVADPIVVSAPQLHFASLVVVGQVTVDGEKAEVKVVKTLKDDAKAIRPQPLPEKLHVAWSNAFHKPGDQLMLLALKRSELVNDPASYEVTPIPRPDKFLNPVVYPYSESVQIQAARILSAR